MKIPFNDLSRQYSTIQKEIDTAIRRVLEKGVFVLGSEVEAFEKDFAGYLNMPHAVGVGSGTDALMLAIKALGLGEGDEVILPANSYPSVFGVALGGVTIRLADVDDEGLMDPVKLGERITKRTKAVLPVHLYGNPCDVFRIREVIRRFPQNIHIIEDCAQSVGAYSEIPNSEFRTPNSNQYPYPNIQSAKNKQAMKSMTGTMGDVGCFSFYPTKNLGAYGDGGMVVTHDPEIANRLRELRMYGEVSRYKSMRVSGVSRLDELQAAILRVKLRHLNRWTKRRREIARVYAEGLRNAADIRIVTNDADIMQYEKGNNRNPKAKIPDTDDTMMQEYRSVFHLFVIRKGKRDGLQQFLASKGIGTAIHYPYPIHLTPSFRELGYQIGDFPVSEKLSNEVLSLPMYPELTDEECNRVMRTIPER